MSAYVEAIEGLREPKLVIEQILSAPSINVAVSLLRASHGLIMAADDPGADADYINKNILAAKQAAQLFIDMVDRARPML
jgi:hypothetical protein